MTPAHVAAKVNAADAELCAEVKLARQVVARCVSKQKHEVVSLVHFV